MSWVPLTKPFNLRTMVKSEFSDGVIICSFDKTNKLNAVNSEEVKTEVGRHFDNPGAKVIMNLGNIGFIDSSGFGALLSVLKKARGNSGSLCLCCITPDVMSLFRLLQLHNIFKMCESEEECTKSF